MKTKSKMSKIVIIFLLILALTAGYFMISCSSELTVVFDVNTTASVRNEPDPVRVQKGKAVAEPDPAPERDNYVFMGWYADDKCTGDKYDFSTPVTEDNFTLYAKWELYVAKYTVTFNYMGKGTDTTAAVSNGQPVATPTAADTDSYYFDGWFLDESCTSKYNNNPITQDRTLYAGWTEAVRINFDKNTTAAVSNMPSAQKYRKGTEANDITLPITEPARTDGYAFGGWFTDPGCAPEYHYTARKLESSITLYANWVDSSVTYTVTFNYNYAGAPANDARSVASGAYVDLPTPGFKPGGREFDGWYMDSDCTVQYPGGAVTSDFILFAKWAETFTVSLDYNYKNAVNPTPRTIKEGAAYSKPAAPTNADSKYSFAFWSYDYDGDEPAFADSDIITVTEDIRLYAQWNSQLTAEAEDTDFTGFVGAGWSGGAFGRDAIIQDIFRTNASNGYFVNYLFNEGNTVTFNIVSDRDVSGADLIIRLSADIADITIYSTVKPANLGDEAFSGKYTVKVNGTPLDYGSFTFTDVPNVFDDYKKPFEDLNFGKINLVKGNNVIKLITDNSNSLGGTTSACAPMVDCLKITTYAALTFTPKSGNY